MKYIELIKKRREIERMIKLAKYSAEEIAEEKAGYGFRMQNLWLKNDGIKVRLWGRVNGELKEIDIVVSANEIDGGCDERAFK